MTLSEFKWIWYMEYGHRMWGRAIGAVFLIPAAIFWSRGMFNKALKIRIGAFGALIGAQVYLKEFVIMRIANTMKPFICYRLITFKHLVFLFNF